MKQLLKAIFKKLGVRVEPSNARVAQYDVHEVELLAPIVLDLANLLNRKPRVLQVGANDGQNNDPLRDLIKREAVEAILVEPMPEPFAKLQELYQDKSDVRLENVAVALSPGDIKMYSLADADGTTRFGRRTSNSRVVAERALKKMKRRLPAAETETLHVVETVVPAKSIQQLVSDAGWDEADVLILDTEGFDRDIVLHTIETGLFFKVLLFEVIFVTREQYPELLKALGNAGYGTARSGRDVLAVHKTSPRPPR